MLKALQHSDHVHGFPFKESSFLLYEYVVEMLAFPHSFNPCILPNVNAQVPNDLV